MAMGAVLQEVDLVFVLIETFSGKRALDDEEIPIDGEDVVNWGNKWVIDGKWLRPFVRIKMDVRRKALQLGTQLMGGFAIPKARTAEFLQLLEKSRLEWEKAVDDFIAAYPRLVLEWADAHPKFRDGILKAAPSVTKLRQKGFRFAFEALQVNPVQPQTASGTPLGGNILAQELPGLRGQVACDIAKDVDNNYSGGSGKTTTNRVFGLLSRTRDKLRSFAFLEPNFEKAAQDVQEVMDAMPLTGTIKGADFLLLNGLMGRLAQPDKILAGELSMVLMSEGRTTVPVSPDLFASLPAESVSASTETVACGTDLAAPAPSSGFADYQPADLDAERTSGEEPSLDRIEIGTPEPVKSAEVFAFPAVDDHNQSSQSSEPAKPKGRLVHW